MNDEVLEKLLAGEIRRHGLRSVKEMRETVRSRIASTGLGEEIVDAVLPPVPEMPQRTTLSTKLNHAYDRIEADLDAMRADVDEALAHIERDPDADDGETMGSQAEAPSRPGTGSDGEGAT